MKPSPTECDKSIAALILSTKRKTRPLSLVQIAEELRTAINCFGDIQAVAERIGISTSMLKRFQCVDRLQRSLRLMVQTRKIDSVDAVAELASLSETDQDKLAKVLENEKFATEDIRGFVRFFHNHPELSMTEITEKVRAGITRRLYVYEFVIRGSMGEVGVVEQNVLKVLTSSELDSVELHGSTGYLKVLKLGKERISREAKARKLSVGNFVQRLCEGVE